MELSVEQQMAVETMDKKVLVVSAAGVGKTRTLTEHAKYLLRNGVNPSELEFTFSLPNNLSASIKYLLVQFIVMLRSFFQ